MAAATNGMALHGGLIPYGGTFFVFTDYMRPAIRLAALMRVRVIHVLTHDSIGLGEDGPTHQPIEHLASLPRHAERAHVYPPGGRDRDGGVLGDSRSSRTDGPSLLVLTRQALPALRDATPTARTAAPAAAMCWPRPRAAARRHADRHRLRGRDRHGARARRWRPRASRSRWSRCPAGSCSPGRTPPIGGGAGQRAAHRHRGRLRLRLGALARPGRRVHRHDRLRRLGPG